MTITVTSAPAIGDLADNTHIPVVGIKKIDELILN
jgi:hypothetical protein